jgi:hypothetical protein
MNRWSLSQTTRGGDAKLYIHDVSEVLNPAQIEDLKRDNEKYMAKYDITVKLNVKDIGKWPESVA